MNIKAKLGYFDTTMIVVGLVIGIGIFRTPAMVASATGSLGAYFTAWILGGFVTLIGGLIFAEIGSRYAYPGAYYKVISEAYHPSLAFMLNWVNIVLVNGAGCAAIAMIGAEYITPVILPDSLHSVPHIHQYVAGAMILALLIINYLGIKVGSQTQNILNLIKLSLIIILAVAVFLNDPSYTPSVNRFETSNTFFAGVWLALISVFYTFSGYQVTINFGRDVKNIAHNLPRAIFTGMVVILFFYLLINLAYIKSLGLQGIANSELVAAETARYVFGEAGSRFFAAIIFLSAFGYLNVTLMHIPRTYWAMAEDGMLPKIFARVNDKTQTQEFALLFLGLTIYMALVLLGTFEKIVGYVVFFDGIHLALAAYTVIIFRKRGIGSDNPGIYKIPLYPILPIFYIIFILCVSASVMVFQTKSTLIGLALLSAGLPVYFLIKRFSKS